MHGFGVCLIGLARLQHTTYDFVKGMRERDGYRMEMFRRPYQHAGWKGVFWYLTLGMADTI